MRKGIQKSRFGKLADGTEIEIYTLTNANGLSCKITNYGAILTEVHTPDSAGKFANIILGFGDLKGYLEDKSYLGATIGRVTNRIAKARFTLNGKTYNLAANDGPNHLHGGIRGFNQQVWRAEPNPDRVELRLGYTSPDMEEGYPGKVRVEVSYELTDANELRLTYKATTDQPTLVNMTNHAYWNLAGHGDILRHELTVAADEHTPLDSQNLPSGKIASVQGTPFDFRTPTAIGSRFNQFDKTPAGYDANYVLKREKGAMVFVARARDPESGRVLELWTDQPGMQLYTAHYLPRPCTGFCLETQNYPDAINQPNFPTPILKPGETYLHRTTHRFSAA